MSFAGHISICEKIQLDAITEVPFRCLFSFVDSYWEITKYLSYSQEQRKNQTFLNCQNPAMVGHGNIVNLRCSSD